MKAHRTDLVSLAFSLIFLAAAAWWLLARLLGFALPPVGWFLAGALILIGVLGLVGALRSGRSTNDGAETAGAGPRVPTPPADGWPGNEPTSAGDGSPGAGPTPPGVGSPGAEPTSDLSAGRPVDPEELVNPEHDPGTGERWFAEEPVTGPPARPVTAPPVEPGRPGDR